jgi:hypothetical protein
VTEKLITLEAWGQLRYGEHAPNIQTLRRWAHDAKIFPAPKKHGRTYYVAENAQYLAPNDESRATRRPRPNRLIRAIDGSSTTQ